MTPVGLIRYFAFFVIDIQSRQVRLAGLTHSTTGTWIKQMVRGLTEFDGFLRNHRYLIMDRDLLFTVEVRSFLKASGLSPVRPSRTLTEPQRLRRALRLVRAR